MAVIFGALVVGPIGAFAMALPLSDSGILILSNVQGTGVGITSVPTCINWGGGTTCVPGTQHQMAVSGYSNIFITAGVTNLIKDLPAVPPPTTVTDFMIVYAAISPGPQIEFDLTSIPVNGPVSGGNCTSNAPLNSCTPAYSPYTFVEDITGTQVTISFSALMNAYIGGSASGFTPYRAVFSTHQSGTLIGAGACNGIAVSITNILRCETAGGTIFATWSATASPTAGVAGPLTITTTSVGNGTVGSPYSQTLMATGGTPPYFWSIVGGRLPVGLSFNSASGQIAGTPIYAETSIVTFQVTDSSAPAKTVTATFAITITSP